MPFTIHAYSTCKIFLTKSICIDWCSSTSLCIEQRDQKLTSLQQLSKLACSKEACYEGNLARLQVMEQSDVLYGRPSEGQVKRMQNAVARIQSISTWEQQLQVLGVQPEGSPNINIFMTRVLRRAWERSLAKGYHSRVRLSSGSKHIDWRSFFYTQKATALSLSIAPASSVLLQRLTMSVCIQVNFDGRKTACWGSPL